MKNLKTKWLLIPLFLLMSSCQSTTAFNLKTFSEKGADYVGPLHIIHVNSSRVRQGCLFLNAEAENIWRHQYFIYVLNDKNEALQIMQPNHMDKKSCYSQLHKIESILKSELQVKVCVRDELKKKILNPDEEDHFVQFGSLGTHKVVYDLLTLDFTHSMAQGLWVTNTK